MKSRLSLVSNESFNPASPGNGSRMDDADLLDAYSAAVIQVAEKISPSVVNIEINHKPADGGRSQSRGPNQLRGSGSGFMFGPQCGQTRAPAARSRTQSGRLSARPA